MRVGTASIGPLRLHTKATVPPGSYLLRVSKTTRRSKKGEEILQSREPRQKSIRGKKREPQHRYDKLFGHIASKKKRDRDDEDHSMATARSSKISQTGYSYALVLRPL
jgi:hypothetical protein